MPPGLHLLLFTGVFFPFSLIALMAAPDAWHNRRAKAVAFLFGVDYSHMDPCSNCR